MNYLLDLYFTRLIHLIEHLGCPLDIILVPSLLDESTQIGLYGSAQLLRLL
jgi:hypothetical protein